MLEERKNVDRLFYLIRLTLAEVDRKPLCLKEMYPRVSGLMDVLRLFVEDDQPKTEEQAAVREAEFLIEEAGNL